MAIEAVLIDANTDDDRGAAVIEIAHTNENQVVLEISTAADALLLVLSSAAALELAERLTAAVRSELGTNVAAS